MRSRERVRMTIAGLLVVAAISAAAGSVRKSVVENTATSVGMLSEAEAGQIGKRFPGLWVRSQVRSELLTRLFPNTAFYKALYHYGRPHVPYLTSISDTSLLSLPSGFNRLLRVYDMEVNDKNKVELAKAFVLTAVGDVPITDPETGEPGGLDSFPPVIFVDANVTERRMGLYNFNVELKVKIGGQAEEWHFATLGSHQFCSVLRRDAKGNTIQFYDLPVVPFPPSRGQLDPEPDMVSEVSRKGDAQAERDSLGTGLASGGKPELESAAVSIRLLTDAEAAQLGQRFPKPRLQHEGIARFRSDVLERVFPTASFYRAYRYGAPSIPYMLAIGNDSLISMPEGFNWLLLEHGTEVSDKNVIELAKAFVLLAVGDQHFRPLDAFPSVTFVEAKRTKQEISRITYDAKLEIRIGEQAEEWYFASWQGQLGLVSRGTADGKLIMQYDIPRAESLPQPGQPDPTPNPSDQQK